MSPEDVRERVRSFLAPRLAGRPLADGDDVFALGYVDSLFALQLARFLEAEFRIELEPEDMELSNFSSVNGMVQLVGSKS